MYPALKNKRILLGVTASIAAYKSPLIVREIVKAGASVRVIMTPSATHFVTPLTMKNLSLNPVIVEMFDKETQSGGAWHIHAAHECDAMFIAPCSATTLGKLANGICDNALVAVATALPRECPLVISPAMDTNMWLHPVTQRNVQILKEYGAIIIPPAEGELASGLVGPGRMPEIDTLMFELNKAMSSISSSKTIPPVPQENPIDIHKEKIEQVKLSAEIELSAMKQNLHHKYPIKSFEGKKVLVTAGPTYERLDDVRFIANYSSGKMGFALARQAQLAGAEVLLVAGPVSLETPNGVKRLDVESADEMYEAVLENFEDYDIAILSAAVADYSPADPFDGKIKKIEVGDKLTLELQSTNDILATLGNKKKEHQILVGFALESTNELENAWKKLKSKNCDILVLNFANKPRSGFRGDDNTITVLFADGREESYPPMSKEACSDVIISKIKELF